MVSPLKVPVMRVTGARSAFCAGLVDGFARGLDLVEIARRASAFRATYVSHLDYDNIQQEDFMELLPKVEIRSIPML